MRAVQCLRHMMFVIAVLILLVGIPFATHFESFRTQDDPDAISGASVKLPEQPSGEFLVFINSTLHSDTLDDWKKFFSGEDFPVIFDDIRCITANGDTAGIQLAKRFQAQLPENQMTLRMENPTLLISKAAEGYIDVVVMSKEMADVLKFTDSEVIEEITVISLKGGN